MITVVLAVVGLFAEVGIWSFIIPIVAILSVMLLLLLPMVFNGKLEEHLRIGFNLEFLSEALKSMEGDEVSAWVVGPLSPVKLIEPQYEALVLPVKVKGKA